MSYRSGRPVIASDAACGMGVPKVGCSLPLMGFASSTLAAMLDTATCSPRPRVHKMGVCTRDDKPVAVHGCLGSVQALHDKAFLMLLSSAASDL